MVFGPLFINLVLFDDFMSNLHYLHCWSKQLDPLIVLLPHFNPTLLHVHLIVKMKLMPMNS